MRVGALDLYTQTEQQVQVQMCKLQIIRVMFVFLLNALLSCARPWKAAKMLGLSVLGNPTATSEVLLTVRRGVLVVNVLALPLLLACLLLLHCSSNCTRPLLPPTPRYARALCPMSSHGDMHPGPQ